PTGHTLRLLALPDTFRALVAMLDAMQQKHRFMVRALTRRYRRDRADDFLEEMRARVEAFRAALAGASTVAALLVTRAEPMVAAETVRYADALRAMRVDVAGLILNALPAALDAEGVEALRALDTIARTIPRYRIPRQATP